ncbi:ABC-2 transporter permease [Anaerococcus kampingiae]|uniref:ABC-2 transporter permease n=1 Tax=Anaerococcus kampingae TaxID=3115614 RepID=A0ABW9MBK9_9FIRM
MKGILLRDFLILYKKYIKTIAIAILGVNILSTLFIGFIGNSLLSLALPAAISAVVVNLYVEDEKDERNKYLKMLPISYKNIVIARFCIFVGIVIFFGLASLLLNTLSFMIHQDQPLKYYLMFSLVGLIFAIINVYLLLPACYKFGIKGANNVSVGVLILIGFISIAIVKLDINPIINLYLSAPAYVPILFGLLILILLGCGSIYLSIYIFSNQEVY